MPTAAPTPTPTPVATPTPTPVPTTTPSPTPVPSFTLSATVSPPSVVSGGSVTITATAVSATAVSGAIVDLYIYAPGGTTQMSELFFTNQTFTAGQSRSYPWTWTSPAGTPAGTYIVKLGVASAGWAQTYSWNNQAASFALAAPLATPTPVPSATPAPTAAPTPGPSPTPGPTPPPGAALPLHVQGNQLQNSLGQRVVLHGVNRADLAYPCVQGWGLAEGPLDLASVLALKTWRINSVRVPLNEDCWLAINGVPSVYSGAIYQQTVKDYVNLLLQNGIYAIVDLHWSAPGTSKATGQQPMPDMDHSVTFWSQVATAFKGNNAVIFDLFNEPWPDSQQNTTAAWTCWRDGGTCPGVGFQAAGMQTLVNAVRATGATNVIDLGGVSYSNALSQWLAYKPNDPLNSLVAAWHVYNFNECSSLACYDSTAGVVAAQVPIITEEIGTSTCDPIFFNTLMSWLDAHQTGYLAWTWNTWPATCDMLSLITDWGGSPTQYGTLFKNHLIALP